MTFKRVTYAKLQRDYRCNECGGCVVIKPPANGGGWHPECGRCDSRDFEHECKIDREKWDAVEALDGLPAELAALIA
jgi:hypothetical protein